MEAPGYLPSVLSPKSGTGERLKVVHDTFSTVGILCISEKSMVGQKIIYSPWSAEPSRRHAHSTRTNH